ncbi:MAG TPA: serine hydrolase [Candidatus Baltobacteraceae bacterium]|nr:serine hydrolase [Candidatus Baltobacteraceae bacterium]
MSDSFAADLAAAAGLRNAAIRIESLDGPERWSSDDGRYIYPASIIKVPLAVAAAAALVAGRLTWETRVRIDRANLTPNDAPSPFVPGYEATVEELVTYMLQRSDNVATNQLYDLLGRSRATADLAALGFPNVAFRRKLSGADPLIDDPEATGRNACSAADAAALFRAIAEDRVPEAAALRRILAVSWWNVKLSRGLAEGDRFAHKTGDTSAVSHDAGILELGDGSRWAIAVHTEMPSTEETEERFGAFMRALRPHLTGRRSAVRTCEPRP